MHIFGIAFLLYFFKMSDGSGFYHLSSAVSKEEKSNTWVQP